jgi:ribosomal protein S18 acetylase RimI-like enzyme
MWLLILGIACVSESTASNHLHTFCVKEGLRSKGFGSILLDEILKVYNRLRLTVYKNKKGSHSDRLIRLYIFKGFREDDTQGTTSGDYIPMKNF